MFKKSSPPKRKSIKIPRPKSISRRIIIFFRCMSTSLRIERMTGTAPKGSITKNRSIAVETIEKSAFIYVHASGSKLRKFEVECFGHAAKMFSCSCYFLNTSSILTRNIINAANIINHRLYI